ncbi:hypothetical protein GS399_16070 [Pedobacter sp. HMF7647]|uniref:DUF5362 domain-containing protein n=1 Tax=Hufsiella arboris TaxID=2695275 RepID=A0A7K1YD30_9SPHI|nr:DUF5362 family protein [Hufsiella arboris]MXV52492.1 hypothetical protein [Hufsiella arboris]
MESNHLQDDDNQEFPDMKFNDTIQYYVYEAAKWAKILSIVGFCIIGLIVVFALFIGSVLTFLGKFGGGMMPANVSAGSLTVAYLFMAAIYFFPTLYLYQFASNARDGVGYNSEAQLTEAFSKLKSFFKFWGVFTLIIIGFYAILFLFIMIGGVGAALGQ